MKQFFICTLLVFFSSCVKPFKEKLLANQVWILVQIQEEKLAPEIEKATIEFNLSEKKFFGNAGCNNYFGSVEQVNSSEIQFSAIGATRKMCINQNVENRYFNFLSKVKFYQVKNNELILFSKEKQKILRFKKVK